MLELVCTLDIQVMAKKLSLFKVKTPANIGGEQNPEDVTKSELFKSSAKKPVDAPGVVSIGESFVADGQHVEYDEFSEDNTHNAEESPPCAAHANIIEAHEEDDEDEIDLS